MAAFQHSTAAPCANPDTFAPAEWLSRYEAAGGWWLAFDDGRISIGGHLQGYSTAQQIEAAAMLREATSDADKRAALCNFILNGEGPRHARRGPQSSPIAGPDAILRTAWRQFLDARAAIEAKPIEGLTNDEVNEVQAPYWALSHAAEETILAAPAATPAGAAIKVRAALAGLLSDRDPADALLRNDLAFLGAADIEWTDRLLVSALIDLDAIGAAADAHDAEWAAALATYVAAARAMDDYDRNHLSLVAGAPRAVRDQKQAQFANLMDVRDAAMNAMLEQPAPDVRAILAKAEAIAADVQDGRWGHEGIASALGHVLADLRRVGGE